MTLQLGIKLLIFNKRRNHGKIFIWFWTNGQNSVTHLHIFLMQTVSRCKYDQRFNLNTFELIVAELSESSHHKAMVPENKIWFELQKQKSNHQPRHTEVIFRPAGKH